MAGKAASPMEISQNLPGEDCGECGVDTCFEFALRLVDGRSRYEECPKLSEKQKKALAKLLAPPMREVVIGVGDKARRTGGEKVMHREDMAFFGKTIIAYDVWDTLSEERIRDRVKEINELKVTKVKDVFGVDAIAVRCVSDDPKKFKEAVKIVAESTDLPIILCSLNAKALRSGVEVVSDRRPMLYAATKDNWAEVLEIAKKYKDKVVVGIFAPDDLDTLGAIAKTFSKEGIEDLILDPGTFCEASSLQKTINNIIMLRRACVERGVKEVSYPIMAVPATAFLIHGDRKKAAQFETMIAAALITKGINLVILHELDAWSFMPLIFLREEVFKHPKAEMKVDPGIYEFGEPDENSPVLTTANYSLTYGVVSSALERSKAKCWLLVVDTGGLSLDTIAGTGEFPDLLAEAVEEYKLAEKVKHRVLIIGEVLSEYKPDIEEALPDWKIVVGPHDATEIGPFLESKWKELAKQD
ncbi:MAG: acetyl-CoA decarbonylase/synthase complex subunit gamma [Candidatus Methanospirareceae archaeon]